MSKLSRFGTSLASSALVPVAKMVLLATGVGIDPTMLETVAVVTSAAAVNGTATMASWLRRRLSRRAA